MPGHPVMMAALVLAGLSFALSPLMPSLSSLTLMILLLGFADGVLDVGANTLLPWVYGDKSGPYFNGLHFVFGLGALGAPLIVARSLGLSGGVVWGFWAMGLCMLPVILALKFVPSPAHAHSPAPQEKGSGGADKKLLLFIVLAFFAYGGAEAAYGGWVFSYAKARSLADDSGAALLTSLFWGALTLGRLLAIPIALKTPPQKVLIVDACGALLSLAILLVWPASKPALWIGTACLGLFLASFFPSLVAYSVSRLSPSGRVSGRVVSFFSSAAAPVQCFCPG
jgi:FHS family Na+ dependent glucose MFS transporter 1